MDDVVVITLFRHGLTEGNKRRAYMGWNDSPLSKEGIAQLRSTKLKSSQYDLFISSDSNRCLQTLELLFPEVQPERFPEFRELNFGDFQGKTYEELKDTESYQQWIADPFGQSPPNGESFGDFTERVDKGWRKIIEQVMEFKIRNPFIVTHGGVIKYLLSKYAPHKREFWDWTISHGCGYELRFYLEELRRGGRCISLQEVPLTENENG